MNHYTKETAGQLLKQLNLPDAVMQIFDKGGDGVHPLLTDYHDPYYIFRTWETIPYQDIVPIWEKGIVLTAYDRIREGFVRFSLEAPEEEWFLYSHFNGIAAETLIDMLEDEDITEEKLDEIAKLFAFPYMCSLQESYHASNHQTYQEHKRWTKEFMLAIGALTVKGS
jgi:hypothetical protein